MSGPCPGLSLCFPVFPIPHVFHVLVWLSLGLCVCERSCPDAYLDPTHLPAISSSPPQPIHPPSISSSFFQYINPGFTPTHRQIVSATVVATLRLNEFLFTSVILSSCSQPALTSVSLLCLRISASLSVCLPAS